VNGRKKSGLNYLKSIYMKNFADRLVDGVLAKGAVCVGIDPRLDMVPSFLKDEALQEANGDKLRAAALALLSFSRGIIDAVKDEVCVVKPQSAFYEQYGHHGVWAFEEACAYAKSQGLLVVADVKRSDIDSTAEAYANAFFGGADLFEDKTDIDFIDAVTLNAYLGWDGIKPFVEYCAKQGKGIFILAKTSNRSSGDFQNLPVDGQSFCEIVGQYIDSWGADCVGENGYSSVGAVVGATHPVEAARLRKLMPHNFFLVPGFGAQGATADDVKASFNSDGLGAIINSSRGINYAYSADGKYSERDYQEAAFDAVVLMKKQLGA
jgi:orotidine-5'-phosphate decarboxylase